MDRASAILDICSVRTVQHPYIMKMHLIGPMRHRLIQGGIILTAGPNYVIVLRYIIYVNEIL